MRILLCIGALLVVLGVANCTGGPPGQPGGSDGGADAGGDGGTQAGDAGEPIVAPAGRWTWIPVEGSKCASGSTAGIGINLSETSSDLLIYLQGGGACWNQGTCVPSLLQYGPICYYNPSFCLYDGPGGTQPTAVYVTSPDPFPADGGGAFPNELAQISNVRAFDRADPTNPFRDATFVFVPYCTGDLHVGNAVRGYPFQYDPFGAVYQYQFHFAGASNVDRYLGRLYATRPNARRIWLTGSSAGGYGATLHFARVQSRFPSADVALLADSSPFVNAPLHWAEWRGAWSLQLPEGCADCDAGFSRVMEHLANAYPTRRMGLLAFDHDKVISYYLYAGTGPNEALSPPTGNYNLRLGELEAIYDAHPNLSYFVLPGEEHVMWSGYGVKLADGGYTAPRQSADGGTNLKAWIDGWATGDGGSSVR
jgi:hypothetical protein